MVSTPDLSDRPVIKCIQTVNNIKGQISSRLDRWIGTGWDQWNRKKTTTKTSSIGKVKDIR